MSQDKVNRGERPLWVALTSAGAGAGLGYCALAVLFPEVLGAWARPFYGAGDLAGWAFLWAAAVMLANAVELTTPTLSVRALDYALIGIPSQLMFGLVFLLVGAEGAIRTPAFALAPWLILAGAAMLLVTHFDERTTIARKGDDDETEGGTPKPRTMQSVLGVVVSMVLATAAIGVLLGAGYLLYFGLKSGLIDGKPMPVQTFFDVLGRVLVRLAVDLAPVMLGIAGLLIAIGTAVKYLFPPLARSLGLSPAKPLTAENAARLERLTGRIDAYARAQGYEGYGWIQGVLMALFFLFLITFLMGPWMIYAELTKASNAAREAGHAWAVSVQGDAGISTLILMLSASLMPIVPVYLAFLAFPRFAEICAWTGALSSGQPWWKDRLKHDIEKTGEREFDPGRFLREYSRRLGFSFFAPAILLAALGAYFWRLDRADYDLLTPDRIVTVDYLTSKTNAYGYADVEAVVLECAKEKSYELVLRGGERVRVEFHADSERRIVALIEIDRMLRAQGVRVEFRTRTPLFREDFTAYREECVTDMAAGRAGERAAQIERILHLDDWRARQ